MVGPNGTHDCLVLELVGPSVADVVASHYRDDRLPAKLAKVFANQALQGLDFLASHDIGHGGKLIRHPWMPSLRPADSTFRSPHPKLGHHNTRPEFPGRKRLFRQAWEASNWSSEQTRWEVFSAQCPIPCRSARSIPEKRHITVLSISQNHRFRRGVLQQQRPEHTAYPFAYTSTRRHLRRRIGSSSGPVERWMPGKASDCIPI